MLKLLFHLRSAIVLVALVPGGPALAQNAKDSTAEARLRKLEAEVSGLQRAVFPGGDGKFFPQIQPAAPVSAQPGTPASSLNTDVLSRLDALERQIARLTGQVEEGQNKLQKHEVRLTALEGSKASEGTVTSPGAPGDSPASGNAVSVRSEAPPPRTVDPVPSATRLAAVKAIVKPSTGNPGDDDYSYGYRLWSAKFYPEAEQQLKMFLQKYPGHPRVSYARNLLGRAYLEDGNSREAGSWFLQNYKSDPKGDRAADSLLSLAQVMRMIDQPNKGCVALKKFESDFPTEAAGRLADQYAVTKAGLKCN